MALVYSLRGNSMTARNSTGTSFTFGTTAAVASVVDAGALAGGYIDLTAATGKCLIINGLGNFGESRAHSFLLRIKANYSGFTNLRALLQFGMGRGGVGPFLEFWHAATTGNISVFGNNKANSRTFNIVTFGSFNPVSGTEYDLFWSWDGTTTANAAKFYVDGTLLGQGTAAAALESTWKSDYFNPIHVGTTQDITVGDTKLVEFCIWDSVEVPTSILLNSGTGSLNGASRTSLVSAAALDKSVWTAFGAADIRLATAATQAGVLTTGTAAIPTAPNVRSGTATDATTGTLVVPAVGNVRSGTSVDATTGTLVVPSLANTKIGVSGDGGTGTYDGTDRHTHAGASNIKLGVTEKDNSLTDNVTGTLVTGGSSTFVN